MRIPAFTISLLLSASSCLGQEISDSVNFVPHPDSVYIKVDLRAQHPEGEKGYRKLIEKNIDAATPVKNGAPYGTYTVWVTCIIDSTGKFVAIVPETNHGYGMEREVIRVLKKLPVYTPAIKYGRRVKSRIRCPFTFVVSQG